MIIECELIRNFRRKPATIHSLNDDNVGLVEGIRGRVTWRIERCVGCSLCVNICPVKAIELIGKGLDSEIKYHIDRCIFCGECVDICPTGAIKATKEFKLIFANPAEMIIEFRRTSLSLRSVSRIPSVKVQSPIGKSSLLKSGNKIAVVQKTKRT